MIKRLHKRTPVDGMANQKRSQGLKLGRYIYLALVAGLLSWMIYWTLGPAAFVNAEGFVDAKRRIVAVEFPAQIIDMKVEPGDYVAKGQKLATIHSHDITARLSDLSARRADLLLKQASVTARREEITALLPLSRERADETTERLKKLEELLHKGIVTRTMLAQEMSVRHDAVSDYSRLVAQDKATLQELAAIKEALAEIALTADTLQATYTHGIVTAQESGIIGPKIATLGEVLQSGEQIVEVISGWPFVVAYLPSSRLWSLEDGDEVVVTDGNETAVGHVQRVTTVAANIPDELHRAFRPRDRRETIRVLFDDIPPFALRAQVEIGRAFQPATILAQLRAFFGPGETIEESGDGRLFADGIDRDGLVPTDAPVMTGTVPDRSPPSNTRLSD